MAWALAFDDTLGTYAELPAPPAPSGNYKFIFTIHRFTTPFTGNWVFTQSNSTSVRGLELEDTFLRVYSGGYGAPFYFDTAWGDNETRVIEATFRNGDLEVDFNVIDDASGTATYPSSIPFSSDYFTAGARRGGSTPQNPNFVKIEYIDLNNSANNRTWDATASDHSNTGAQPVLVDTIGGNNATGVNFPTDGSAWVDLGGGVSVNVSDSLSESASSANNDSIVYVGEFSVLGTSSNSSGLANQDSISFASTVNISDSISGSLSNSADDNIYLVGELVVNDLIVGSSSSANQDNVTLAATISVNDSLINSISLAINDSIKLSGAFDVIEQLVNSSAIANSDLVAFSSTVSVSDQSSNSQSDSFNDAVSFVGAFSVNEQLTNSLSLSNVEAISFSGEIILTDGVVSSSSLSTSDFIQIGAFNFTVYKETNISSTFKSRNIDSPSLSTNIDG